MIPVPVKYNFYGDVCSIIHSGSLLAFGGIVLFNLISVLGTVFLGLSPKTLYFSYCPLFGNAGWDLFPGWGFLCLTLRSF